MSSELVSGPDLGGGFLHQLSVDREGSSTHFTFHAQAGGSDANGPPRGPLDVFGFVHPPTPCMFGGPRCWHRRFLLPVAESGKVRQAYQRNRFVLDAMMGQAYLGQPVPFESALREVVTRISGPMRSGGIGWYLGGSAAARLVGVPIEPRDIDLGTTEEGVDRVGELLRDFLIEPVALTDWPRPGVVRGARAFVGTFREGARVEWSVPFPSLEPLPLEEWSGREGVARLETVSFAGETLRVTRPEYALVRAAEAGRNDRAETLATFLRTRGADAELLGVLLDRSPLPEARQRELLRSVTGG